MEYAGGDIRESVVMEIIRAMASVNNTMQLQMLEDAVRNALHGINLEKENTELSTEIDNTQYLLECFVASKSLEGCQEATLRRYVDTVNKFFCIVSKNYMNITKDDVKMYLMIRKKQIGQNTLVNEKRNLSSFFTWLHDEGFIPKNPVKPIKGIREEETEIIYLSPEEEVAVRSVKSCDRNMAIVAFLLSTGVRVGEMESLNISDVDMRNGSVTFRGEKSRKGKYRTVFLDVWARCYLERYLSTRTDNNPALFVSERNYSGEKRRIKKAAYEKITHKMCREAGITNKKKGTVHSFRRTFATSLADKGCQVEIIQELLGHASAATTMRYYVARSSKRIQSAWETYQR